MDAAERRSQLEAVEREIDDLNKQVAEADDEGNESKASGLRDRLHAAKKSFTALNQASDDSGDDEEGDLVSDEATETTEGGAEEEAGAEETADGGAEEEAAEEAAAEDGDESEEAAGDEAAPESESESESESE